MKLKVVSDPKEIETMYEYFDNKVNAEHCEFIISVESGTESALLAIQVDPSNPDNLQVKALSVTHDVNVRKH